MDDVIMAMHMPNSSVSTETMAWFGSSSTEQSHHLVNGTLKNGLCTGVKCGFS